MNFAKKNVQTTREAMIYVKEIGSYLRDNGRLGTQVLDAIWLVGVNVDNVLYAMQQSIGSLLDDDEVLVVEAKHCQTCRHADCYADFAGYAFETEPDQMLDECSQLQIKYYDDLSDEIRSALDAALEIFQTRRASA